MQARHRSRFLLPLAAVVALALTGALRAEQDKPLERRDLDERIYNLLRDVINTGADLYNPPANDRAGCYRLYHGALLAVRPLLDHRPTLQQAIDAGLADAQRRTSPGERAFTLRAVIDKVRADVRPETLKPPTPAVTLWDRLGGEKGVAKVVDDFVALAASDAKVNFFRDGKYKVDAAGVATLKKTLVEMISEAAGGPLKYSGKSMKEVHKGMGITDAEFDALAADLKKALADNGVKPEDAGAVLKAVESTRKDIVESKPPVKPASLWDRLGGEKTVSKVIDDFVDLAANNPKADFTRGGKFKPDAAALAVMKKRLVEMVSEGTGGPLKYSGKSMKEVHKGMAITDAEFDALAGDLKTALEKNGVKADAIAALLKIVETTRKDVVEPKKPEGK
jgi:hemoglobin